jgi:predicted small lipoprotein YifL
VNFSFHVSLARIAAVGALFVALGLAGCGRKSGLDPPPAAEVSQPGPGQPDTHFDDEGKPVAPPSRDKRPFILDWLVD